MKCRNCGQTLYFGAKICPNCNTYQTGTYRGVPNKRNARDVVGRQPSRPDTSYSYRPDRSTARHVVREKPPVSTPRQTATQPRPADRSYSGSSGNSGWLKKALAGGFAACVLFFGVIFVGNMIDSAPRSDSRRNSQSLSDHSDFDDSNRVIQEDFFQETYDYDTDIYETYDYDTDVYETYDTDIYETYDYDSYIEPTEQYEQTQPTQETQPPVRYADELFQDARDTGACKRMTGDIGVMYVFMDDATSYWTQPEIDAFLAQAYEEMNALAAQAHSRGVNLTFHQSWMHCSSAVDAQSMNVSDHMTEFITAAGGTYDTFNQSIASQLGAPQAYPVFIFNEDGRAFAYPGNTFEACVLFDEVTALRHESCHVFGAEDLYYSKEIIDLTNRYLAGSIMADSQSHTVDDLTAYLLGWTDTLSYNAQSFLDGISWMTQEDLDAAYDANTITGYGTHYYSNGDRYEGEMYMGVPHGQGTFYYADGGVMKATFDNGYAQGWCEITFADGAVFRGNQEKGEYQGICEVTYADGTVSRCNYEHGIRQGWGEVLFHNGDVFQGNYVDDQQLGQGKYVWAGGTWYEGEMKDCSPHGYGTMTFYTGQVQTGNWNMGQFLG